MEEWKDIQGYEGLYQVSNLGRVKSFIRKDKILKQHKDSAGYLSVTLCNNGNRKKITVHKLMAIVFLNHKPQGNKIVVDHVNNIKNDNRLENLQIISQRLNCSKDKKTGTSKYTGVNIIKETGKWRARIQINGKTKHLGVFENEIDANQEYRKQLISLN